MTFNEIITDDVRSKLAVSETALLTELNKALAPLKVEFIPGKTVSAMCKESAVYKSKSKQDQTEFVNEVKSLLRLFKVGEHMTLTAVANGFWAQFNGTTAATKDNEKTGEKRGDLKKVNISLVRPDIKASKLDDAMANKHKLILAEQRAKALEQLLVDNGVDIPEAEVTEITEVKE